MPVGGGDAFEAAKQLGGMCLVLGGGSRFLRSQLDSVSTAVLYSDTVPIPDPVMPWLERNRTEERFHHVLLLQALVGAVVDQLVATGTRSMLLWVLEANAPARRFYEVLGGAVVREQPIEIGGVTFTEVAYGWSDLEALLKAGGA